MVSVSSCVRRVGARYGLRGERVGEASHPSHPRLRVLLGNEVPTTGDASGEGRAIHDDLPSTVVASPRALAAVRGEVHGIRAVAMNDSSEDDGENGSNSSTETVVTDEEDREPRSDVHVPLEGHVPVGSVDGDPVPVRAVDMPAPQMPRRVFLEALRLLDEVYLALIPQKGCGDEISCQIHAGGVPHGSSSSVERSDRRSVGPRRKKTHKGHGSCSLLPRLLLFRPPRGGLIPVRPRRLDCVLTSARERRKWGREEGKPCIAVGSDGGLECSPPGFGGS